MIPSYTRVEEGHSETITKKKHHVSHETPPDYALSPDGKVRQEKEVDYNTD